MGYRTPVSGAPESELDRCYQLLGLTRAASEDDVKLAFRKLAREFHPDVSKLPKDEAEARFKRLYAAYRYIKTASGK
ncbi:MAG: DnaJ domain-containing protein [Anaerolinea sp.]|nr:DnaJ domain-containing protein [Anaerolinea sp.]